ncbi:MAG: glycosyltransferase [Prevotella sp.]|jgi:glycosyltransferase involved in cell wall biosynthesis|nr:glycosyltransferase family 2 protein [Prevotella sp.]MCH3993406.1 glycosyltransferase [Prevotella sp.]MCI1474759.1 glycosyltransferase [Prevotella sp.]
MIISFIIATFNAGKTLKRCLDSIVSQLTNECELILVDGGSKDNTNEIIASYGDKIAVHVSEPDKGIYDAWNKGVSLSSGRWVGFIGADDVLLPNAVKSYLHVIKTTSDIDSYDYICAHNEYADKDGNVLQVIGGPAEWSKMRRSMVAAHVASLHNKHNLFETIGGYDLQFHICADYDLLLRKRNKLKSLFIDTTIARMQTGGMSFSVAALKEAFHIRQKNHSINMIENISLYLWYWMLFKTYHLRHR